MQRLEKILAQKTAPKVTEWPSYGNLSKVTQNRQILNTYKRGTKRNFSKIAKKVALAWKAQKHSNTNGFLLYLICASSANTGEDFGAENGFKSARMAKLCKFSQGHPKPAFSEKVQRGYQGIFFKNRPKSSLRLKGAKALWRKWHYPQTSMHLKCKKWKRFWCKVQREDHGKIFKNRPKRSPRW